MYINYNVTVEIQVRLSPRRAVKSRAICWCDYKAFFFQESFLIIGYLKCNPTLVIESESKLDLDFSVLRAILDGIERKRARFLITLVLIRNFE